MRAKYVVSILLLALGLAACADGEQATRPAADAPAQSAGARRTIRFVALDRDQATYERWIAAFEEENPDLHVEIVWAETLLGGNPATWPDDLEEILFKAADVVALGPSREAVNGGLIYDLAPLIAADAAFDADDFYPNLLEAYRWAGGTWALPLAANFQLIYYDPGAFDAANVAPPQPGWTWEAFLDAARALKARTGGEGTRWGFVEPWPDPRPFVEGRGGPLVDYAAAPPRPRFDDPEVAAAVRWYADLYLAEGVAPYFPASAGDGAPAVPQGELLVEGGQAAMWTALAGGGPSPAGLDAAGVAPYPVEAGAARGTTPFWPSGVAMSAGSGDPQAAWRWLVFLSRQPPAGPGAGPVLLPARRSVAAASGFWDGLGDELAGALRYAADHSLAWHPADAVDAVDVALDQALAAILGEAAAVDEALAEAQAAAQAELATTATGPGAAGTFAVEPPGGQADGGGAEVVTFLVTGGAPAVEKYLDLAARFREDHPDIAVDVAAPGFEQLGLVDQAAGADCFQWVAVSPAGEEQAAILSLDPLLEADPTFPLDDFYPQLLDSFRSQGQLWGLPSGTTPYLIEYNKDLFDAAGFDYPAPGWTTDDFLATAVALTKGEGETKQYGFVGQVYEFIDLMLMLDRLGARLVDDGVDPPALTFDDPATVEAVAWYAALSAEYGAKPILIADLAAPVDQADFVARDALIDQGRAAMWTSYGPNTDFVGREDLNLGVVPLPVAAGGRAGSGYLRTDGYYISSTTAHRQACWLWITFLSGQVGAAEGLPARRSVAESDAYRRLAGDERAAAYLASLEGESGSVLAAAGAPWLNVAFRWLYRAYDQVLAGEASAEQALQRAQRLADEYRACVVGRDASTASQAWEACFSETDPELGE